MIERISVLGDAEFVVGQLMAYNSAFKTWSIEHYTKCSFRCAYCCCDAQGKSVATVDADRLMQLLEQDFQDALSTGLFYPKKTKVILSCHVDPYVDIESSQLLTRKVINFLIAIEQPFIIGTRGVLIERDLDLLAGYKENCEVHFSLPYIDPVYLKKYEPHVPPVEDRIKAIFATQEAGIRVTVRINPWIPGVTDVEAILALLPKNIDVLLCPLNLGSIYEMGSGDKVCGKPQPNEKHLLLNTYLEFTQYGFCQTAKRLFSDMSQDNINREYIRERNRIGFRRRVKWYYPPLVSEKYDVIAWRFLLPNEIVI